MEKQDTIVELLYSFMKTRAILTGAELDLFTQVHSSASSAKDISQNNGLDLRAATRLLDSLATIGLLNKQNDRYGISDEGLLLSSEHPKTVLPMVLHLNGLWDTWSNLTETIRKGENLKKDQAIYKDKERQKAFIGAMHVIGLNLAEEIADTCDLARFRKLLDIGGGSGTYTIAFLKNNPNLTAILFDLEDVIPLAEERLKYEGYLNRVSLASGDLNSDEFPEGCDLVLLSAIIHMNSPDQNADLFRRIYQALTPGGVLIIRDHIMDESRTFPPDGALFALNMLVNTQGGDTYTFSEIKNALSECGFVSVKLSREGEKMDCLVEATKQL